MVFPRDVAKGESALIVEPGNVSDLSPAFRDRISADAFAC